MECVNEKRLSSNQIKKIPILDIPGLGTYQYLNGNEPKMQLQGTRVTLLFSADSTFYKLSEEYNSNATVKVLDFVNAQRQLKAKMLSLKGSILNRDRR